MNTTKIDELIIEAKIPQHDITFGDLQELVRVVVLDCVDACHRVAADADDLANSKFVTDTGKVLHQGMWGGAQNSAAMIASRYGLGENVVE